MSMFILGWGGGDGRGQAGRDGGGAACLLVSGQAGWDLPRTYLMYLYRQQQVERSCQAAPENSGQIKEQKKDSGSLT